MSAPAKNHGIVVGVDGSPASNAAVCWAAHEAVMRHLGLVLVHVVNPVVAPWPHLPLADEFTVWRNNEGRRVLADALKVAQDSAADDRPIRIETVFRHSGIVTTLVDLSEAADMIVVGTDGRGALARGLLGSVSSSLLRRAHCPAAVIHNKDPRMSQPTQAPVVVGVDGSPASLLATEIAFDEASRRRVDLVAVHAWSDVEIFELPGLDWSAIKAEEERGLAERLAGWQERYPDVTVHRLLVCDRPAASKSCSMKPGYRHSWCQHASAKRLPNPWVRSD